MGYKPYKKNYLYELQFLFDYIYIYNIKYNFLAFFVTIKKDNIL